MPTSLNPRLLLLGVAWLLVSPLKAAPEYAVRGYATQLEKIRLADTPMGPISALDLLMWDDMTARRLGSVPAGALLDSQSAEASSSLALILQSLQEMVAQWELAREAAGWNPPDDLMRVRSFGAAEAVWAENHVRPLVKVEDIDVHRFYLAHPDLYIRRRQAQVRYIFHRVDDMLNAGKVEEGRRWMENMRQQIPPGPVNGSLTSPGFSRLKVSESNSGKYVPS